MTKRAAPVCEAACERVQKRGRVEAAKEVPSPSSPSPSLACAFFPERGTAHRALQRHRPHFLALLIDRVVLSVSQAHEVHTLHQLKGQLVAALRRVDGELEAVNERFNLASVVSLESSEEHQFHAASLGMHARTISATFRLRGRHTIPDSEGEDEDNNADNGDANGHSSAANEGCVVALEMSCESMDGNTTSVECKCGTMWALQHNKFSWSESSTRKLLQLSGLGEWEVGGEASDLGRALRLKWFAADVSERMMALVRDKHGLEEARHMAGLGLLSDDIFRLLRLD